MTETTSLAQSGLLKAIAGGRSVFVLGPGCHRMGYDSPANLAWREVTQRMRLLARSVDQEPTEFGANATTFLRRFWVSRLSDETRELHTETALASGRLAKEYSIAVDEVVRDLTRVDELRTRLLVPLVRALRICTIHLGAAIASGEHPVLQWQNVRAMPGSGIPDSPSPEAISYGADEPDLSDTREDTFAEAAALVAEARDVATVLAQWSDNNLNVESASDVGLADLLSQQPEDWELTALRTIVECRVATFLEYLHRNFFGATGRSPVTGATVEWLGDLVWLIVILDSGLVLSETELATYLNLRVGDVQPAAFARAKPGDLRTDTDLLKNPTKARALRDVLEEVAERSMSSWHALRSGDGFWKTPRGSFALTVAASVMVQWRGLMTTVAQAERDPKTPPVTPQNSVIPLVLTSDHDLTFETALMTCLKYDRDLLREGRQERFHVVTPVVVDEDRRDWLIGDFYRTKESVDRSHVEATEWRWLSSVGNAPRNWTQWSIRGPVVIKMHGSPLHRQRQPHNPDGSGTTIESVEIRRLDAELIAGGSLDGDDASKPADEVRHGVAYTELDFLRLIHSLVDLKSVPLIEKQLTWNRRSWLFLGHRFPDFLPRLRLYMTARDLPGGARFGKRLEVEHLAIDRRFSWPESAFLASMNVHQVAASLQVVDQYWDRHVGTRSKEDQKFIEAVKKVYDNVVNASDIVEWTSRGGGI